MSFVENLKSSIKINVAGALSAAIIISICKTVKWRWIGLENLELQEGKPDKPRIWAVWHGRQILIFGFHQNLRSIFPRNSIYALTSPHDDGMIIAKAMHWMGMETIHGSSSRGGLKALRAMVRQSELGNQLAITPDGPKGPPYVAKAGIVRMAQLTGRPITPVGLAVNSCWRAKSWDKMVIPKPFSKGIGFIGSPISVPAELSPEEFENWNQLITKSLNDLLEKADSHAF